MRFTYHRFHDQTEPSYICLKHDKYFVVAEQISCSNGNLTKETICFQLTRQKDRLALDNLKKKLVHCNRAKFIHALNDLSKGAENLQSVAPLNKEELVKTIMNFHSTKPKGVQAG